MVEHINYTDSLKQGTDKLNQSIDQSNEAKVTADAADAKSDQALANSESTQTQLDQVVIEGDSSVEAAQARVDADGTAYETLKARLDDKETTTAAQLAETAENAKIIKESNPLLISAFNGQNGTTLDFYVAYEKDKFIPLNTLPLNGIGFVRDPSTIFHNGHFYVAYTGGGPNKFTISKSSDLINWETYVINLPMQYTACWAPQWFKDNDGSIYIIVSLGDGSTATDIYGSTINFMKTFIIKALDTNLATFSEPVEVQYSISNENHIDACLIKHNDIYYQFVKDENTKVIKLYKATSIFGQYVFDQTIPFTFPGEGPSVVNFNGEFILYVDNFEQGASSFLESTDLENWTNETFVTSLDGSRTQHFDVLLLSDEAQKIVDIACRRFVLENAGSRIPYSKSRLKEFKLKECLVGTTFTPIDFNGSAIYSVSDEDIGDFIIENIPVPDPQKHYTLKLVLSNGSSVATSPQTRIILKNKSNGGNILTPNYRDFLISPIYGLNNVIVELDYRGRDFGQDFWRVKNVPNFANKNRYKTNLGTGVIDNLQVVDKMTYYLMDNDKDLIINGLDTTNIPVGVEIYFVKYTAKNSKSKIVIKNGSGITPFNGFHGPNWNDLIITDSDIVYKLVKVDNDGFRLEGNLPPESIDQLLTLKNGATGFIKFKAVKITNAILVSIQGNISGLSGSADSTIRIDIADIPSEYKSQTWVKGVCGVESDYLFPVYWDVAPNTPGVRLHVTKGVELNTSDVITFSISYIVV